MPELIVIMVIALIVFGPKKLPDLAKSIAKGMAELKKATEDVKESLEKDETFKEAKQDLADSISGIQRQVEQEGSEALRAQEKKEEETQAGSEPPQTADAATTEPSPSGEAKRDGER
jgi:TatA/E family protein of Tat protein translocase